MLELLGRRYGTVPQGFPPRYIHAHHVRNDANWASRTADMMIQDTWAGGSRWGDQSRIYPLHGFEVKVSRADWLAELRHPEKSEAFIPYLNYWWLVVPDKSLVAVDELPIGWGLLARRGRGLGCVVEAVRNLKVEPMPIGMRVGLMRSITKTVQPCRKPSA